MTRLRFGIAGGLLAVVFLGAQWLLAEDKPTTKPGEKPRPVNKSIKPGADTLQPTKPGAEKPIKPGLEKPTTKPGTDKTQVGKPAKPAPPSYEHPMRDPLSVAAGVDREIDRKLAEAKVPAS